MTDVRLRLGKIFLICSVRHADKELNEKIQKYIEERELEGWEVHWPKRDTNQVDPTGGVRICTENRAAILSSDRIDIWWDPKSSGSHFDIGMLFMLLSREKREIVLANHEEVRAIIEEERKKGIEKSFSQFLWAVASHP